MLRKIVCLVCGILLPLVAFSVSLSENAPQTYTIQSGDTLWGIASKYLDKPWEWHDLWHANPHIKNPNRIYPGMRLTLHSNSETPYITVTGQGTYKLSPHARFHPSRHAVPTIPLNQIKPFLNESIVFNEDLLTKSAYIVGYAGEHLRAGQDVELYVQNLPKTSHKMYTVYRPSGEYKDPHTQETLGYIAEYIADLQLVASGQPATLMVTKIQDVVKIGDRVLPKSGVDFPVYFEPKTPLTSIQAEVIDFFGGLTQVAQNQVIVINFGKKAGVQPGDVFALYARGEKILDPTMDPKEKKEIQLPNRRLGEAMVFHAFDKVSYALIVHSTETIHKGDLATSP